MYIITCIILSLKISSYESIDNSSGVWDMSEIHSCTFISCVCIFKFIGGVVIHKAYVPYLLLKLQYAHGKFRHRKLLWDQYFKTENDQTQ